MGLALPLNLTAGQSYRKSRATEAGRDGDGDGDEGGGGMMKRSDAIQLAWAGGVEFMPLHAGARGSLATTTRGDIHSLTDEELKDLRMHRPRVHDEQREGNDVASSPPDGLVLSKRMEQAEMIVLLDMKQVLHSPTCPTFLRHGIQTTKPTTT